LLIELSNGKPDAFDEILPLIYGELKRVAANYLRRERSDHTLLPTALVNEAYMKMVDITQGRCRRSMLITTPDLSDKQLTSRIRLPGYARCMARLFYVFKYQFVGKCATIDYIL